MSLGVIHKAIVCDYRGWYNFWIVGNFKKYLLGFLVLAILAGGAAWWKKERAFDPSVDPSSFETAEELESFWKNLSALYEKDTYGGETPEQTLQLFIDALKKGDTDLAAKYFVPEKQKKESEDLGIGKDKGNLTKLIEILEKEKRGSYIQDNNHYEFNTFDQNGVAEFSFSLVFNPSTKIWKIESL